MALLIITVIKATNLPNVKTFSDASDACVCIEFKGQGKETKVIPGDSNPKWNEQLMFDLDAGLKPTDKIIVTVKDRDSLLPDRLLGQTSIGVKDLLNVKQRKMKVNAHLKDSSNQENGSTLKLLIEYDPLDTKPTVEARTSFLSQAQRSQSVFKANGVGGGGAGGGMGAIEEENAMEGGGVQKQGKGGKRVIAKQLSNKPQDFQIRIKIIEGRQLQGANISPVTKVSFKDQFRQTRVKTSTAAPFWDELFFFNCYKSPVDLMDELIFFNVYNSRTMRADAPIGCYRFNVGTIYNEDNQCFVNKWLLLSNPECPQEGAKGYLKISAAVLGPGDKAPSFDVAQEDVDIETNLLCPAGVQLRPAIFTLKLYLAEDLAVKEPVSAFSGLKKMFFSADENKMGNPYLTFDFAGNAIKSPIIYNNMNPGWNVELKLCLQWPSMCDAIRLVVWNNENEEAVGAVVLNISAISAVGEPDPVLGLKGGFLPTFGPCYLNMYGAPREKDDSHDGLEVLNSGKGEGMAYRGRLLLELTTNMIEEGSLPEEGAFPMSRDSLPKIKKFLQRRRYKCHAVFLSAGFVMTGDDQIEFELSVGNYGNKLDDSVAPSCSTTQPTNPVFDGNHYHFLPWGAEKPAVMVDCEFEDVSTRLYAINYLLSMIDRLENNIEKLKVAFQANLLEEDQAQFVNESCDELIMMATKFSTVYSSENKSIPENELDMNLRAIREEEMTSIANKAKELKNKANDIKLAIDEFYYISTMLKMHATDPQNSMPDVVIWMIIGGKRRAFYRIKAYDVFYCKQDKLKGRFCNTEMTINLVHAAKNVSSDDHTWKIPAQLRVRVWLGWEKDEKDYIDAQRHGKMVHYAETYENQVCLLGSWVTKGPLMSRPDFSDATGTMRLEKEKIQLSDGMQWSGDWFLSPEYSLLFDQDSQCSRFVEDVFINESRTDRAMAFSKAQVLYSDVKGLPKPDPKDIPLPSGWTWDDEWHTDNNGACDEDGWAYCVDPSLGGYVPGVKNYHMHRRKRLVRTRVTQEIKNPVRVDVAKLAPDDCWEYAILFNKKFHLKNQKLDLVRRRRWHRLVKLNNTSVKPLMKVSEEKTFYAPLRLYLKFKETHKYQLRAYIYQARDLLSTNEMGHSNPYSQVAMLIGSDRTKRINKTVCPTWDQTLILKEMDIYDDPKLVAAAAPQVMIEIFDFDSVGEDEYLGRTQISPVVKIDPTDNRLPVLQWHPIMKQDTPAGEILATFELILLDKRKPPPPPPRKDDKTFIVPEGIAPVVERKGIEILTWGVRNMAPYQMSAVASPVVNFEIGGSVLESGIIQNLAKNPNFPDPIMFMDVMLPHEELYMPPLNILVRDNRQFGRKPIVGQHVLASLETFLFPALKEAPNPLNDFPGLGEPIPVNTGIKPSDQLKKKKFLKSTLDFFFGAKKSEEQATNASNVYDECEGVNNNAAARTSLIMTVQEEGQKKKIDLGTTDEDLDWYCKYYASRGEVNKCGKYLTLGYDLIQIVQGELEKSGTYNGFNDFCSVFPLYRGRNFDYDEKQVVGEFRGSFWVYPLPDNPEEPLPIRYLDRDVIPKSEPIETVFRVYVIKCIDLQPNNPSGLADSYMELVIGGKTYDNKDNYVPNTLSPQFGHTFEVRCVLPTDKDLIIRVRDYDLLGSDDVIGETKIDLESRLLTKFRATCGLPKNYNITGPNMWRDNQKPTEILDYTCLKYRLGKPEYNPAGTLVNIFGRQIALTDAEIKSNNPHRGPFKERTALKVLTSLPLVKEHVEMRPLYSTLQPGIEQGCIHMWVDMFPTYLGPPGPPEDISPRKPKKYVLRVIIRNTMEVVLNQQSFISNEKMSDIYVKGWVAGIDERQETDVHYRSLDGEGNFNWRFVFPFEYLMGENQMVIKKRESFFSLDQTEMRLPCNVIIQIWDNDKFSADDFLGTLELDLSKMPAPAKKISLCTMKQSNIQYINLFECRRAYGFWPCINNENVIPTISGKVEMELELITAEEAEQRPAGFGRDEPNENPKLDPPNRPETSFFWFTSPFKTFRYIIWKNFKCYFIGFTLLLLLVLFIMLFVYAVPGQLVKKILGGKS